MKARRDYCGSVLCSLHQQLLTSTIVASLLLSFGGLCANKTGTSLDPPLPPDYRFQLQNVALADEGEAAWVVFETGKGKLSSSGERAGDYARKSINALSGDPGMDMVTGPVGLAAAPFMAAWGAIKPAARLPADKRADAQSDLQRALNTAAVQKRFQEQLIKQATETPTHNLLLPGDSRRAEILLKTWISSLELKRAKQSDDDFVLVVLQKLVLTRLSDGARLYEGSQTFVSQPCPYIDWTRGDAVVVVADSAYRVLARETFAQVLSLSDAPVLTGAGHRDQGKARKPAALAKNETFARTAAFRPVSFESSDSLGVFSVARDPYTGYTKPMDKEEAANRVIADLEYHFDGLHVHANPAVAIISGIVAIPMSLYKQGEAMVTGTPSKDIQAGDEALLRASRESQPHADLAASVAQSLAPRVKAGVMLAKFDGSQPMKPAPGRILEINVVSAVLAAANSSGTRSALEIEAVASVRSLEDGRLLYSCPVKYRSAPHHFKEWSKSNAALFRQTQKAAYATLSEALTEQLAARGLVPAAPTSTIVARN